MSLTARQDHNRLMNNTDKIVHIDDNYTMADTDRIVVCADDTYMVTLPPPGVAAGDVVVIKAPKTIDLTGTIIIAELTNGAGDIPIGSVTLATSTKAAAFFSDGSSWLQIK
jgi:hypothetical protein